MRKNNTRLCRLPTPVGKRDRETDRHGPAHKPKLFIVEVWKEKEGLGINCSH
jgi:hypothetical protein